jgi:hemerythrin-like domain-containing protein
MSVTACETPGCAQPRVVVTPPCESRSALTEEHTRMLAGVAVRVDVLVRVAEADEWPTPELKSLVRYLQSDVLQQATREEQECYAGASAAQIAHLGRDHARLRAATEILARAAAGEGSRSVAHLAATARSLFSQLQRHVGAEQELLQSIRGRRRSV